MESSAVIQNLPSNNFWLRNRCFDLFFIIGTTVIALMGAGLMLQDAHRFSVIAALNVTLLATPHVISTYTRICFDRKSFQKYFFLTLPLPVIVIALTSVMQYTEGGWLLTTVYLYWQWWHYTRQSYGISRMYLAQARKVYTPNPFLDNYAMYALPLCGILYRSWQQPSKYLGVDVYTFPVSLHIVYIVGIAASVLMVLQFLRWQKAWREGALPLPYVLYMISHYIIFACGYLLISDINFGWLLVNIWHNLQYIMFVWLYNNRHFKSGIDPEMAYLSKISQEKYAWLYFLTCVFYAAVLGGIVAFIHAGATALAPFPWIAVIYMSINYHHYIVDAIVWKRKRRTVYA